MKRWTSRWLALVVAVCAGVPVVLIPSTATRAVNADRLWLEGEDGDFIASHVHTGYDTVAVQIGGGVVEAFGVANGMAQAMVSFRPPAGTQLTAGTSYVDDGTSTGAQLDVSIANSCSTSIGRFTIAEISIVNDVVQKLVATWTYTCGSDPEGPSSFGGVSFNGTAAFRERRIARLPVDFGPQAFLTRSSVKTITITNDGPTSLVPASATLIGRDATSFRITADRCSGVTLAAHASCGIDVDYWPLGLGTHEAAIEIHDPIAASPGRGQRVRLTGSAAPVFAKVGMQGERDSRVVGPRHLDFVSVAPGSPSTPQIVRFHANEDGHSFSFAFAPPIGGQLSPGTFTDAVRISQHDATIPALTSRATLQRAAIKRGHSWWRRSSSAPTER